MSAYRIWNRDSTEATESVTIIEHLCHYSGILSPVQEILASEDQVMSDSNMMELGRTTEISEFSDSDTDTDTDTEVDEDEYMEDDIPYNDEWEAPSSETSSDEEDEDIPDDMECTICRSRQVTVQFSSCCHGACNTCLKGIYRSRRRADDHFPTWFPCHICRAETWYVGEISLQPNFADAAVRLVVHGEQVHTIWNWVLIRRWAAKRSRTVSRGLREKAMFESDTYLHDLPDMDTM